MTTQRIFYKVLYDFQAEEEGELSVTQGTFVQTAGACSSYPVRRAQQAQFQGPNNGARRISRQHCTNHWRQPAMRQAIPTPPFRESCPPMAPRVRSARFGVTPTLNHSPLHSQQQTCVPSPPALPFLYHISLVR